MTAATTRLTREQKCLVQLLSAFSYLTTRQVGEYLGGTTTKRATERKLRRLAERGLVGSRPLQPRAGAASERCWFLLEKCRGTLGVNIENATVPNGASYATRRQTEPTAPAQVLTGEQEAVVRLLADMKQLTTRQIRAHLHTGTPTWYTRKMLYGLSRRGYLRGARLNPELGAVSEYYWRVTRRGAAAVGATYSRSHELHPARQTIEYRGLLLEMRHQVAGAGWSLINPVTGGAARRHAVETPQRRQLVEAVLRREGLAIEKLLMQGYPASRLAERIDRWNAGQVGAVVPRRINEHVAYVPGHSEWSAVLIPHPPQVGRAFWTRSPGARLDRGERYPKAASRLKRYSRLATVVPVLAVFTSQAVGKQYADLLASQGFVWISVQDLGSKLKEIAPEAG